MKKIILSLLLVAQIVSAQKSEAVFLEHQSQLRIPFNHASYSVFEQGIYLAEDSHTSVKPYVYNRVSEIAGLEKYKTNLLKDKNSWGGRKLWNEHLVELSGKDYWFHLDVLLDVDAGIDNTDVGTTLNNTRILKIEGQLGSKFSYSASVFESQTKYTQFIYDYIKINQPEDASGLIPGRGKGKTFGTYGQDYGVSIGYVSYTPTHFFNVQLGHGQNFIGDGYRSLFLSDVSAPSTYAKATVTVGKVQYTSMWMWLKDFNYSIDHDPSMNYGHKRKYGAFHHLSWNVSERFNLGFFEGIITDNTGGSGAYPAEYLNPIIFYKNIEFANGEDAGNGIIGVDFKYRLGLKNVFYGQFLLDDFKAAEFFKPKNGYWANKNAIQVGAKFFDAFKVKGLQLQTEFNRVTPFTYSHEQQHNYAHFGQPLAHLWGANFWEAIFIARYNKNRWGSFLKAVYGKKGFDIDTDNTPYISYGGNVFVLATERNGDYNQKFLQGNVATNLNINVEVSYLINPSNNFKLFAGALIRNFTSDSPITRVGIEPESVGYTFNVENTQWFFLGVKADLFNNYKDY